MVTKSVQADECDARVAALVSSGIGVTADNSRRNSINNAIEITSKYVNEASVECPTNTGFPIDLYVNWNGAFPPASFYKFAGRAAHIVVGVSEKAARVGAMKCQQAALRADNELAQTTFGDAYFECQAFSRDDGGTAISIYPASAVPQNLKSGE
jgi:hypothetical protein